MRARTARASKVYSGTVKRKLSVEQCKEGTYHVLVAQTPDERLYTEPRRVTTHAVIQLEDPHRDGDGWDDGRAGHHASADDREHRVLARGLFDAPITLEVCIWSQ